MSTCSRCGHVHRSSMGDPYCVGTDFDCTCPAYVAPTDDTEPTIDWDALAKMRAEYAVSHYSRFFPEAMFTDVLTLFAALDAETRRADAAEGEVERLRAHAAGISGLAARTKAERDEARRQVAAVRALHVKGYGIARDEAWQRDPVCVECNFSWPCATIRALGDES